MPFGAKRLCDQELIGERSIMREHLFRGKLKNKEKWMDKGEWIKGSLLCYDVEGMIACRIIESFLTGGEEARAIAYEVDPETVCQYTGLHDNTKWEELREYEQKRFLSEWNIKKNRKNIQEDWNGRKIFEGDIISAWSEGTNAIGEVKQRIDGLWIIYPAWQKQIMWKLCPNDKGETEVKIIGNIFDDPELKEEKGDTTYEHDRK